MGKVGGTHYLLGVDRHVVHLTELAGASGRVLWALDVHRCSKGGHEGARSRRRKQVPACVAAASFASAAVLVSPDVVRPKLTLHEGQLHVKLDFVSGAAQNVRRLCPCST